MKMGKKVGVSKWCRAKRPSKQKFAGVMKLCFKTRQHPDVNSKQNKSFAGPFKFGLNWWLGSSGQITFEFIIAILFIVMIFVYGVMLFENKNNQNVLFNYKWNAQLMADRLARNINNVYLMDNNSTYEEYFYWQDDARTVTVSEHAVLAWWDEGAFSDSPIVAKLDWQVTDVNGLLIFEKINNSVVVRYG